MFGSFLDYAGSGGAENQRNIVNSDSLVSVANPCARPIELSEAVFPPVPFASSPFPPVLPADPA